MVFLFFFLLPDIFEVIISNVQLTSFGNVFVSLLSSSTVTLPGVCGSITRVVSNSSSES